MDLWIAPLLAFIAVLVLIPPARILALRVGFVDAPGGRKDHAEPVPPIGGLVLFPVYMVVAWFTVPDIVHFWPLLAALTLIVVVGALDDYRHINPWVRFAIQFVAAGLIVVPGGAQLHHLGDLIGFGTFEMGVATIPFSMLAVALLITAVNMMDGLDGLAAGKSFVILLWLVIASVASGQHMEIIPISALMGALAGFLKEPPPKYCRGDVVSGRG